MTADQCTAKWGERRVAGQRGFRDEVTAEIQTPAPEMALCSVQMAGFTIIWVEGCEDSGLLLLTPRLAESRHEQSGVQLLVLI